MVDVWLVPQRADTAPAPWQLELLSEAERERARRFHRDLHRNRFVRAHAALRTLLGSALNRPGAELTFEAGPQGKPALAGDDGLHFNLSSTEGLALVALSRHGPLGVDVERHRPDPSLLEVAERFFSPAEVTALREVPTGERLGAFHRIWTRKEAYIKAVGLGLSLDLDTFDVSLKPGPGARLLATRPDAQQASRWRLVELDLGPDWPDHSAALVTPAPRSSSGEPEVRLSTWDERRPLQAGPELEREARR